MGETHDDEARRAARASWPVRVYRLGDEPEEPFVLTTTPAQRLVLLEELSRAAWVASGRPFPTYTRANAPGRVIRTTGA